MNILISNDDGVFKYGLKVLANALASMEDVNVYVFAPSQERSCAGHGLFLHEEQVVTPYSTEGFDRVEGVWACSGTPADCVKTGVSILRSKGIPIDMVCTGSTTAPTWAATSTIPAPSPRPWRGFSSAFRPSPLAYAATKHCISRRFRISSPRS